MRRRPTRPVIPPLGFDRLTVLYDAVAGVLGYGAALQERVFAAAAPGDGETLLDIGMGTGTFVVLAKSRLPTSRVIGVEPDLGALRRARGRIARSGLAIETIQAQAEALPIGSGSVDVVVSSLVFHHLGTASKLEALGEIRRVLRPNGRFLLADFGPPDKVWSRVLFALIRRSGVPEAATLRDNVDGRLPLLLDRAGFAIQAVAPTYRGLQILLARVEPA